MHAFPLSRAVSCAVMAAFVLLATSSNRSAIAAEPADQQVEDPGAQDALRAFCDAAVGAPRVVSLAPGVFVAVGYDVANVTAIGTPDGVVVIDTGSCTSRAAEIRQALAEHVGGPIRAIIYTHHQIEQTGGAGVWADEPDVEIWATGKMPGEFHRQYMLLDRSELRRGIRQFGLALAEEDRIPSALGRNPASADLNTVPVVRMPTQTFDDEAEFELGGVEFQLIEAPGETADHLMVWVPALKLLVAGDNFARGFPEMYSVRGTAPSRPDAWIHSLDRMRGLEPQHLVASRHQPISGAAEVQRALTNYRDAIQWLRDETLRAIGRGDSIDEAAGNIHLPEHLAANANMAEFTGRVEWAVRAIYTSYVGWFDERPEALYPLEQQEAARREIEMMGGADAVLAAAQEAKREGSLKWALHLCAKLRASELLEDDAERLNAEYAGVLNTLADQTKNSSGASYLASMAHEVLHPATEAELLPCPDDETINQIPLDTVFEIMSLRLKTDRAMKTHESIIVYISDEGRQFNVTIRRGVVEVDEGTPLWGMPKPVAILVTDGLTWRKLCMGVISPAVALATRKLDVQGNRFAAHRFAMRFECDQKFAVPRAEVAEKPHKEPSAEPVLRTSEGQPAAGALLEEVRGP